MSAPRPGMATLLTLRHARSEAAKTDLSATRSHRRELEDALRRDTDALRGADLGGGGSFAAAAAHRALLHDAVTAAGTVLAVAVAAEEAAATRYQADRRAERVIEKLLERLELAREAARDRAEQAGIDELAVARYVRSQRGVAADRDAAAARSAVSA